MFRLERKKFYDITIEQNPPPGHTVEKMGLTPDELDTLVIRPYNQGITFVIDGKVVRPADIASVDISETLVLPLCKGICLNLNQRNVTTQFVVGPPGGTAFPQDPLTENSSQLSRLFDHLVTNQQLREATRKLFLDQHYSGSAEKGFVCVENAVKEKSGISDKYGASLMRRVFSPNSPILSFNSTQTQSDRDEQEGYMHLFEGAMIGIRNPRAHGSQLNDEPEEALRFLGLANHLLGMVEKSQLAEGG